MGPSLFAIPLALLLSAPHIQNPQAPAPRDARGASHATAILSGVVVSDDADARPVRRVRVTCGGDAGHGLTAVTDDQGRFLFPDLPAGRYTVLATRAGWVNTAYGAKRPMRPGSAIPIADGEKKEIVVRMLHGAVITGTILDQNNEPAARTTVNAMRNGMQNGERRLVSYATATTDDRGVYRIYGLPPGEYVVGVPSAGGFFNARTGELRLINDAAARPGAQADARGQPSPFRTVALASTYFPGTATAAEASVVTLRGGEERGGIDFSLHLVATARVEGSVTSPDGTPPSRVLLSLLASGQTAFPGVPFDGYRTGSVASDGSFSLSNVSPGQYTLLARTTLPPLASDGMTPSSGPRIVWASAELSVDGEDVTGISLSLQPAMTLAGQVRFDGTTLAPANFANVRVSLAPVQTLGAATLTPNAATVRPDGRFLVSGITPGQYRLMASFPGAARPGGWMLRSALVSGQDALDAPLVVQPGQNVADVTITFTDLPAQLTGTLQYAGGGAAPDYTILLFPADQAFWTPQSRRIQALRPSADGTFAFSNLAGGIYRLAAVDDIETGEWFDPSVLQRLLPTTIAVTIGEGEHKVQNIQIGGG